MQQNQTKKLFRLYKQALKQAPQGAVCNIRISLV